MVLDEALATVDKLKEDFLLEFSEANYHNAQARVDQFKAHLASVRMVLEAAFDERIRHGGE